MLNWPYNEVKNFLIAALIFSGLLLLVFYPIFFGGKILNDNFAAYQLSPFYYFYGQQLKCCNSIPTWFSGYLGGFPVYLGQGIGFLHPLAVILFKLFDFITAWNGLFFFNLFFAGLAVYLLARNLLLSVIASILAGAVFIFNGFVLQWAGLVPINNFLPLLPLALLSILKISQKRYLYLSILWMILTLGWISSLTETLFYLSLAGLFFAIYLDFINRNKNTHWLKSQPTTFLTLGVLILSLIIASPWVLPVYQFSQLTPRSLGLDMDMAYQGSLKIGDYINAFYPYRSIKGGSSGIYIGLISLVLLVVAFIRHREDKFIKFFLLLFIFVSLLIMPQSPLLWLVNKLPIFSLFRGLATKMLFIGHLAVAILVGFGLDRLSFFNNFFKNQAISRGWLASLIIFELIFFWQSHYSRYSHLDRELALQTPQTALFLQGDKSIFRITSFQLAGGTIKLNSDEAIADFKRNIVAPNLNILWGLDSVLTNADGFVTRRLKNILNEIYAADCGLEKCLKSNLANSAKEIINGFQSLENQRLLSMMNVKYVLSPVELGGGWQEVFKTSARGDVPIFIYQNLGVLPRTYFANKIKIIPADENSALSELLKIDDFAKTTLLECDDCVLAGDFIEVGESELFIRQYKAGKIKLRTKSVVPKWLILSENNLPNWTATINGRSARIYFANYLYQAIYVPAGENDVEFSYPGIWGQYVLSLKRLL